MVWYILMWYVPPGFMWCERYSCGVIPHESKEFLWSCARARLPIPLESHGFTWYAHLFSWFALTSHTSGMQSTPQYYIEACLVCEGWALGCKLMNLEGLAEALLNRTHTLPFTLLRVRLLHLQYILASDPM